MSQSPLNQNHKKQTSDCPRQNQSRLLLLTIYSLILLAFIGITAVTVRYFIAPVFEDSKVLGFIFWAIMAIVYAELFRRAVDRIQ